jgi:hypothetical protein
MKAKFSIQILTIALVLSLGIFSACSRTPNDGQILSEVQSKIGSNSNLQGKQVQVQASGGVVTLSGSVDSDFERTAAGNEAAQVKGVKTVVNNLQVVEPVQAQAPAPPPVVEEPVARPGAPRRQARAATPPPHRDATPAHRDEAAPIRAREVPEYNDNSSASMAAPPKPVVPVVLPVSIPEGSALPVRLIDALNSETNQIGDSFRATLSSPVIVDGQTVIPANADVEGRVVDVKSAGRFAGQSVLTLELTRLAVNGKSYDLRSSQWTKAGTSRGKRTAATIGGGSALGAIIGGIAGGGKGAAIGAAVGAGAGTGVQAATKGQQIDLPSETVLSFTLAGPLSVIPSSSRNR